MPLSQIGAAVSLVCIMTGIVAFFFPGGWIISAAMIVIVIAIWFLGFSWRVATAADNIIEKYQDGNIQDNSSIYRTSEYSKTEPSQWNGPTFRSDVGDEIKSVLNADAKTSQLYSGLIKEVPSEEEMKKIDTQNAVQRDSVQTHYKLLENQESTYFKKLIMKITMMNKIYEIWSSVHKSLAKGIQFQSIWKTMPERLYG